MRLALLSTARINAAIVQGARAVDEVEVVAVGSRDRARAEAHAREHGIARAHGSYEAVLEDPDVDAVYVPLPNSDHVEWSVRALEAGKHVLCEKPLARTAAQAERAFDAAERAGRVLSEAFMWRHHPQTDRLAELARTAIGELRLVRAHFSFLLDRPGDVRLLRALDGGAVMDVGCYCLSGMRLLAGEPERVTAEQVLGGDGVDARLVATLRFAGGVLGHFDCGMDVVKRAALEVAGTEGSLVSYDPWHGAAPRIELLRPDGSLEAVEVEAADPYVHQLRDFAAAAAGRRPPRLGREDAVGQARAIEAVLAAAQSGRPVVPTSAPTSCRSNDPSGCGDRR